MGFRIALAAVAAALIATPALAQDATGTWLRDTGASRVRIAKCGEALCGTIVWLREAGGPARVGQRIFFDMKPNGAGSWRGQAFNPEDGQNYTGTMRLNGNTLTTAGCRLGGLICRSVNWSRAQ